MNGPYLSIYRVACDASARTRACLYCSASYKQSNQAAAAKRLFWHLTARQIFTASLLRLSHRKYPIHSLPLRFFLLYSQIGNLYFFRNDLCLRYRRHREIVSLIGQRATPATYKVATNSNPSLMYAATKGPQDSSPDLAPPWNEVTST